MMFNCTDSLRLTPLYYACAAGHLDVIRVLIEYKENLYIRSRCLRFTALMLAALAGQENVVSALVYGYQCLLDTINLRDCEEKTVLHYACMGGNIGPVRTLIQEQNIDGEYHVRDLFCFAVSSGREDIVTSLIGECSDEDKSSFLWSACGGGSVSLVQTLIQEHNYDGLLHEAASNRKEDIALALINEFGL